MCISVNKPVFVRSKTIVSMNIATFSFVSISISIFKAIEARAVQIHKTKNIGQRLSKQGGGNSAEKN